MIVIQLIGLLAFIFLFISYYNKDKKGILWCQLVSFLLYSIHFLLLGAFTGSLLEIVCFLNVLSALKECSKRKKLITAIVFFIIYIIIGFISYSHWYSFIPVIACIIVLIVSLFGDKKIIKLGGLLNGIMWAIYSYFVHSYAGVFSNTILFILVFISLFIEGKHER